VRSIRDTRRWARSINPLTLCNTSIQSSEYFRIASVDECEIYLLSESKKKGRIGRGIFWGKQCGEDPSLLGHDAVELATTMFRAVQFTLNHPDDGGSRFLRNVSTYSSGQTLRPYTLRKYVGGNEEVNTSYHCCEHVINGDQ
jgi:hypothetical protein